MLFHLILCVLVKVKTRWLHRLVNSPLCFTPGADPELYPDVELELLHPAADISCFHPPIEAQIRSFHPCLLRSIKRIRQWFTPTLLCNIARSRKGEFSSLYYEL